MRAVLVRLCVHLYRYQLRQHISDRSEALSQGVHERCHGLAHGAGHTAVAEQRVLDQPADDVDDLADQLRHERPDDADHDSRAVVLQLCFTIDQGTQRGVHAQVQHVVHDERAHLGVDIDAELHGLECFGDRLNDLVRQPFQESGHLLGQTVDDFRTQQVRVGLLPVEATVDQLVEIDDERGVGEVELDTGALAQRRGQDLVKRLGQVRLEFDRDVGPRDVDERQRRQPVQKLADRVQRLQRTGDGAVRPGEFVDRVLDSHHRVVDTCQQVGDRRNLKNQAAACDLVRALDVGLTGGSLQVSFRGDRAQLQFDASDGFRHALTEEIGEVQGGVSREVVTSRAYSAAVGHRARSRL